MAAVEVLISVLILVVILLVLGYVAHYIIRTFFPAHMHQPALLIAGVILLIILLASVYWGGFPRIKVS